VIAWDCHEDINGGEKTMKAKEIPVFDLIKRNVVTIGPNEPVQTAARLMKQENIGCLIVVDGRDPVGMVTERDFLTKILAEGRPYHAIKVKDVMSSPLMTISPSTSVFVAAEKMVELGVRRFPIMDEDKILGVITESDLLQFAPDLIEVTRAYLPPEGEMVGGGTYF
jgi:CBS domain-containing protein